MTALLHCLLMAATGGRSLGTMAGLSTLAGASHQRRQSWANKDSAVVSISTSCCVLLGKSMRFPRTSSSTLPSLLASTTTRISDILACMFGICAFRIPFPPHSTAHNDCKCCRIVDCMFLFCFASEGHDMQTVMKSQPELHWGRSFGFPRFIVLFHS